MADIKVNAEGRDEIAQVVIERFRRAREHKSNHIVHQGKSIETLLNRANHQYRREYTSDDADAMRESFGFCPSRYYGLVQLKTNAVVAWKSDLMINNLDSAFTVAPSPVPELDQASLDRIRDGVKRELVQRMVASGVVDPNLLLNTNGKLNAPVETFLQDQVRALKRIEDARIVSLASVKAEEMRAAMRDALVQGGYRSEYQLFSFNQVLQGVGIMRFPDYRRVPVIKHRGRRVVEEFEVRPVFRNVRPEDFYPISDGGSDLQNCTAVLEVQNVTKAELINMMGIDGYDAGNIEKVLDEYQHSYTRDWLSPDHAHDKETFWGLDETIPILIHEGFLSGSELADAGVTGVGLDEYVNATVIVCGGFTIRITLNKAPTNFPRSYHAAAFTKCGSDVWDVLGIGAMLWDTEQRINRMMHMYEHNLDWSARTPLMRNTAGLKDADDLEIVPGQTYDIGEAYGPTGNVPDPIRPMKGYSAQYQLIMNQLQILMRQADEECGVPAYAYGAQDFGRSSLGEYTQRMSNALRVIKACALNEDIGFIEPAFRHLFIDLMKEDENLREGQDVDLVIRGMTGILKSDIENTRHQETFLLVAQLYGQGMVGKPVMDYGLRQMLSEAGYPVDALGMEDPQIDLAFAKAANTPQPSMAGTGQQVPTLDGRSGVPIQNVANPDGSSNASLPLQ